MKRFGRSKSLDIYIFVACGPGCYAYEDDLSGHGHFTRAFMEVLRAKPGAHLHTLMESVSEELQQESSRDGLSVRFD